MNNYPNSNIPGHLPGHGYDSGRDTPAPGAVSHGGYPGYASQHAGYGHGPGAGADWPPGMAMRPYQSNSSWLNLSNDRFINGALIGAAAAYLLTNESVQRTLIKSAVRAWTLVQSGVEEVKERFHDAEAEVQAEANKDA
jgi:hypothetical protein